MNDATGRSNERGFTLLEVVVALAVMAMQLGVLLEVQASSLAKAGAARDFTIATLLARSKLVDLEIDIEDEGFSTGVQTDEGNFDDEGHPEIKWSSKLSEVQLDLSLLTSMCGLSGDENSAAACEGMLGGLGGPMQGLADEIGNSIRLLELEIAWPSGKTEQSFSIRAVVMKEDLGLVDPTSLNAGGANSANAPGGLQGSSLSTIPGLSGGANR